MNRKARKKRERRFIKRAKRQRQEEEEYEERKKYEWVLRALAYLQWPLVIIFSPLILLGLLILWAWLNLKRD